MGPPSFLDCGVPTKISTIATARLASFVVLCLRRQSGFFFPASDARFFVLHCVS